MSGESAGRSNSGSRSGCASRAESDQWRMVTFGTLKTIVLLFYMQVSF